MSDLIDRQAAIEALGEQPTGWSYGEYEEGLISQWKSDVETIKQLPSAEPQERKAGRWILDRSGAHCCSKCMEPCATYVMMKPRDKFCKMCGARMEVEHE